MLSPTLQLEYEESRGGLGRLILSDKDRPAAINNHTVQRAVCFPLQSILLALGTARVDYLSLDVEGKEMDILDALPLQQGVDVGVVSMEYAHGGRSQPEYRRVLVRRGYQLYQDIHRTSWFRPVGFAQDYVFVREDLFHNKTDISKRYINT